MKGKKGIEMLNEAGMSFFTGRCFNWKEGAHEWMTGMIRLIHYCLFK